MNFFSKLSPEQQRDIMINDWCTHGVINIYMYLAYCFDQVTFDELKEEASRVYRLKNFLRLN